jgi:MFS family permease
MPPPSHQRPKLAVGPPKSAGYWIQPWYFSYALLGVAVAGLIPILLPLFVNQSGNPSDVGVVMAAFSLGGLTAPLWGELADRHRLHRVLLAGGLLLTGITLAALVFTGSLPGRIGLAFLQGTGFGAAGTVANLFIVENHPRAEWDERIGWLQTFYGTGQVVGLLLSAVLTGPRLARGILLAAGFNLLAFVIAWWKAPAPSPQPSLRPVLRHVPRHAECPGGSPQRLYNVTLGALRDFARAATSTFAVFLLAWTLSYAGTTVVFSQYPVLMRAAYGIGPTTSSLGFGVAAAIGLLLYAPAGGLSDHIAPLPVVQIGLGLRLLALAAMLAILVAHRLEWFSLLAFVAIVVAWSLLSVSGTGLVARISPVGEGSGMGIFNAATAVAGVIGAAVGGWAATRWGYRAALELATASSSLGLLLTFFRSRGTRTAQSMRMLT